MHSHFASKIKYVVIHLSPCFYAYDVVFTTKKIDEITETVLDEQGIKAKRAHLYYTRGLKSNHPSSKALQ